MLINLQWIVLHSNSIWTKGASQVHVLLEPQDVTTSRGKRHSTDVTDEDEVRLEQGQSSALGSSPEEEERHRDKQETVCDDRGRDWSHTDLGAPQAVGST